MKRMTMEDLTGDKENQSCPTSVSDSTVYKPTMCLRWYEIGSFDAVNNEFYKILQQKFQGDKGHEVWKDIEIYEE